MSQVGSANTIHTTSLFHMRYHCHLPSACPQRQWSPPQSQPGPRQPVGLNRPPWNVFVLYGLIWVKFMSTTNKFLP